MLWRRLYLLLLLLITTLWHQHTRGFYYEETSEIVTIGFVDSFAMTAVKNRRGIHVHPVPTAKSPLRRRLVPYYESCHDEYETEYPWNITIPSSASGKSRNQTVIMQSVGSYRRIEDWHEEHHDPSHVIEHLKRERAKWQKTFEDLGGDGI
jgi:hypothetical protein